MLLKKLRRVILFYLSWNLLLSPLLFSQNMLEELAQLQKFQSLRISSFDRTGGNNDRLFIQPGETKVIAEIEGPAAIHHIWITVNAEPFYGRKIVLRIYWDNERHPSVEAPLGDFFGVGHGLNRNLSSLPIVCSSEGRARNCYWYMPFRESAKITVTNEGQDPVDAFYYYIDYRRLNHLSPDTPYFHAQYRQEFPCQPNQNYLILEAQGQGHYIGCNLSILQESIGWWGEGDDMIYIDGEEFPSLHGTGSEDYFSDAWGMREDENLFYGCPLQEADFQAGSKATVYRFHIPDPIPFTRSLRVTIEHGHLNNRADLFSSVAYWYQLEPHLPFPSLPPVTERLPYAYEEAASLLLPDWEKVENNNSTKLTIFKARSLGWTIFSQRLVFSRLKEYAPSGARLPVIKTDGIQHGDEVVFSLPASTSEPYQVTLYYLQGPDMGTFHVFQEDNQRKKNLPLITINALQPQYSINKVVIPQVFFKEGLNKLIFRCSTSARHQSSGEFGFITVKIKPAQPRFISEWQLIGPFDAPDMSFLDKPYPPEEEINLSATYSGKNGQLVAWRKIKALPSGYVRLDNLIHPSNQGIIYALVYIISPKVFPTKLLIGSDDGIRIWLNGQLIHTNPAYRGAYPDQDSIPVVLHKGWNTLLLKVLQGEGGWGFYVRFVDPEGKLRYQTKEAISHQR